MTPTFPPIDPATVAGLSSGDERALERIFRSHYPTLLERAREQLPDEPASAPRVVAAAVRELWNERAGVHTSAEVESFLLDEVGNRARAVRARMGAVHRFEKNEGISATGAHAPPDADLLWTEIAAGLHAPVPDPATTALHRREHARHDAAGHIANVAAPRSWKAPLLIGALAGVVAIALFVWMNQASRAQAVERLLAEGEASAVSTRSGQLGSLSLQDGSAVRLGAESRLVVVAGFGSRYRTLRVTGTGSFTVRPGSDLPFEVRVSNAVVTSTEGVVTVRDYADEDHAVVRADGGEAQVRTAATEHTVPAGQAVIIARDGTVRDATAQEAAQAFAWTDGRLRLNDVTAGAAADQLRRWYGMSVAVVDSAAVGRRLSLDVPLDSSQAAIDAIEDGARLRFGYRERQMVFEDTGSSKR